MSDKENKLDWQKWTLFSWALYTIWKEISWISFLDGIKSVEFDIYSRLLEFTPVVGVMVAISSILFNFDVSYEIDD